MSILTYNGVELDFIQSRLDQEVVLSEDKTDYLYTEFTITVSGVITENSSCSLPGESTPAQVMQRIRSCLLRPRQSLTFEVNSDEYLVSPENGQTLDAKNGPMPIFAHLTQVNGTGNIMIQYQVKTWKYECCSTTEGTPGNDSTIPAYVSNRWSDNIEIDEEFYTRRTRTGTIVLRSNALADPDSLRTIIVAACPIPVGFVRERSVYNLQRDGLAIQYTIVDQEKYKIPPFPSVKWSGRNIVSTNNQQGAIYQQEIVISMTGDKDTPKGDMIVKACKIALARAFATPASLQDPNARMAMGSIMELLHENTIELHVRLIHSTNIQGTIFGFNSPARPLTGNLDNYGVGIDPGPSAEALDPTSHGSSGLKVAAAALNDPCLNTTLNVSQSPVIGTSGTEPTLSVLNSVPLVPNETTLYTQQTNQLYTDYKIDVTYRTTMNRVQLPLATNVLTTCTFASLSQPTSQMMVTWTAEAVGSQPSCPNPYSISQNFILMDYDIAPASVVLATDGQSKVFRVSGRYVYGIVDPTKVALTGGVLPFLNMSFTDTVLNPPSFQTGIYDTSGVGSSAIYTTPSQNDLNQNVLQAQP